MEELSIDPKADDFSEEKLISILTEKSKDHTLPRKEMERYEHLVKIIGTHKFWEQQPIMLPKKALKKEGMIQ